MIANSSHYKILVIMLSIVLLIVSVCAIFMPKPTSAPNVSFKTINNKTIHLKELQGKIVLITFWASNCPNCLKEIPDFKNLYRRYHHQGLEIIAIAMYYDRPNYVVNINKEYQIPYAIALDLQMHLAKAFGHVSLIPTTFLINPQGKIIYQTTGVFDLIAMQNRIEALL